MKTTGEEMPKGTRRRRSGGKITKNVIQIRAPEQKKRKTRVAVYCRVSTERESQISSIRAQQKHYESLLLEHDEWELVGMYVEAGVSGTRLEGRVELDRLLEEARRGGVDRILTKSISRFARNTTECLTLIRELNALGTAVYFEKENIDTSSMEGELVLAILSSLAEDESRSISQNAKWAVQKRFEKGVYRYSNAPYGYDLVDGTFRINEEEASVVRYIFDRVLSGVGTELIARELNEAGIPTKNGDAEKKSTKWHSGTLKTILHNVTYTGDILMQKTYRDESFKARLNFGEVQRYYMDGHHEGIITPEEFELAQAAIRQRGREKGVQDGEAVRVQRAKEAHRHYFSGRLVCGYCGNRLKRISTDRKSGKQYKWCCIRHHRNAKACSLGRIRETEIQTAFCSMMNKLRYAREAILEPYIKAVRDHENAGGRDEILSLKSQLREADKRRKKVENMQIAGCLLMHEYRTELLTIEAEKRMLEDELKRIQNIHADSDLLKDLEELSGTWKMRKDGCRDFPEKDFIRLIDSIKMTDREMLFVFKCGLSFREERS